MILAEKYLSKGVYEKGSSAPHLVELDVDNLINALLKLPEEERKEIQVVDEDTILLLPTNHSWIGADGNILSRKMKHYVLRELCWTYQNIQSKAIKDEIAYSLNIMDNALDNTLDIAPEPKKLTFDLDLGRSFFPYEVEEQETMGLTDTYRERALLQSRTISTFCLGDYGYSNSVYLLDPQFSVEDRKKDNKMSTEGYWGEVEIFRGIIVDARAIIQPTVTYVVHDNSGSCYPLSSLLVKLDGFSELNRDYTINIVCDVPSRLVSNMIEFPQVYTKIPKSVTVNYIFYNNDSQVVGGGIATCSLIYLNNRHKTPEKNDDEVLNRINSGDGSIKFNYYNFPVRPVRVVDNPRNMVSLPDGCVDVVNSYSIHSTKILNSGSVGNIFVPRVNPGTERDPLRIDIKNKTNPTVKFLV